VHVTGIGKPEHVASYAASLLASTGTPATFLHGTEACHGSAGQVLSGDVVIAISNSGRTAELLATVACVKRLGARVIAVTGGLASPLAEEAEVVLDAGVAREGGGLGLAPRASVAAEILVLAALSAALEEHREFSRPDYHARHPGGALGEKSRG
jgi:arabinose-5-phosphate isomerase